MTFLRILANAAILAIEIGLIVAVAVLGHLHPALFAALTAFLSFVLGVRLEAARLKNELPFYFGRAVARRGLLVGLVATLEAAVKGLLAGLVALLTFSGTDQTRLFWVSVVFAACLLLASSLLRSLWISLDALPARWGYFRLAAPFGVLFSIGVNLLHALQILPPVSLGDIARRIVWETAPKPSIEQVSELLFVFKQYVDNVIVGILGAMLPPNWAQVAGAFLSINLLSGFVVGVYAVVIAEVVRRLEAAAP